MPIIQHDACPIETLPRTRRRTLASRDLGATETTVSEQWLPPEGYIPLHYHEVEEVVILLRGEVEVTLDGQKELVSAEATLVIPAGSVHGMRPAPNSGEVYLLALFPTLEPKMFFPDGSQSTEWKSAKVQ
jgi:quercetin dioxygenase-like cupin family protein